MNREEDNYIAFLLVGLNIWKWMTDSITKSAGSILANLNLLKKIKLSSHIFPIVEVFQNTWKFLLIFVVMIVCYSLGFGVSWNHFYLLPMLLVTLIFIIGFGVFLSSLTPLLPDLNFIISYAMRLLFYGSGVVFAAERVPEKLKLLFILNPFAAIIQSFRNIMIDLEAPNAMAFLLPTIVGVFFGVVGGLIIKNKNRSYAKLY